MSIGRTGPIPVIGPLTDDELRATPVPVSGTVSVSGPITVAEPVTVDAVDLDVRNLVFATDKVDVSGSAGVGVTGTFFQATQPVSAASLPLPTGAATEATLLTRTKPADQQHTIIDSSASIPVTGSFFQATQPVSLAVAPTTPVTGTFFQATQPVSIASMPSTPVTGTFFQATQPVSATDLDIRNLVFATDKVDVTGSVVSSKIDLTPSAPTFATVGVASAEAVAAAATRKGLILVNTSSARISLGFGAPAVLDSGLTLYPSGSYNMGEYDFDLGAVNAIASAAASNLAVQQYLT